MEQAAQKDIDGGGVKFEKGCPICEHSDPELERDLEDFAQILFDLMLADPKKGHGATQNGDVDNLS